MDYRLLLLMHVPQGLKIDELDLERLLAPELDYFSRDAVVGALLSDKARAFVHANPQWVENSYLELKLSEHHGIRWVYQGQDDYPLQWMTLSERPIIFNFQGEPIWKNTPLISIVGSRTPSQETLAWMQRELPNFFRGKSIAVVSGGARGVDQWAHRLALDCGKPTICILPSGILNPYPFERDELWARILKQGGCMVSTCGVQAVMRKSFFSIRNRWIAGLSELCFVAEANRRSGSMLTANLANEEHRTVCTLPVFPTATQGLGNLDLIAQNSVLLRDHHDLTAIWNASKLGSAVFGLRPATLKDFQREKQEDRVDKPQTYRSRQDAILRHAIRARIANPISDEQN